MTKEVRIRFRRDHVGAGGQPYEKGAEFDVTSDDAAHKLYGDAIDIVRYADGSDYEQSLKEQAAQRREADGEDVVISEKPAVPKAEEKKG